MGTVQAPGRIDDLMERGPVGLDEALALYDALPPVAEDELAGEWDGALIATGHPGEGQLATLRWAGKHFRGRDDVDPMVCLDEHGERAASDVLGRASVRRVEYRGVVSAAMVYDRHPVIDHFRRVDADVLVGAMERKGDDAPLLFVLRRRGPA